MVILIFIIIIISNSSSTSGVSMHTFYQFVLLLTVHLQLIPKSHFTSELDHQQSGRDCELSLDSIVMVLFALFIHMLSAALVILASVLPCAEA